MVEFAINNSMHASTSHTPFFVNGLRHPRLPALLESDSYIRGGGTRSSTNRSGSCSSRANDDVATYDADVDNIDIDEEDINGDSNDAVSNSESDSDDDAGIFSIVNDYTSEDEDTLAEEENKLLAVRNTRTVPNKGESAEDFLLTREAVVRFVQDSIANAVDRQKRNADKH